MLGNFAWGNLMAKSQYGSGPPKRAIGREIFVNVALTGRLETFEGAWSVFTSVKM